MFGGRASSHGADTPEHENSHQVDQQISIHAHHRPPSPGYHPFMTTPLGNLIVLSSPPGLPFFIGW
jgi:hypothetical protein